MIMIDKTLCTETTYRPRSLMLITDKEVTTTSATRDTSASRLFPLRRMGGFVCLFFFIEPHNVLRRLAENCVGQLKIAEFSSAKMTIELLMAMRFSSLFQAFFKPFSEIQAFSSA